MNSLDMPKGWSKLSLISEQYRLWNDNKRFAVIPSGRRSGKTELAKRKLVLSLNKFNKDSYKTKYFAAAPTKEQAKRIFWEDLKDLVPKSWVSKISETDLFIRTVFGSELWVVGMDKPERIEGSSWDGGVLDEYANMKPETWGNHVRPSLSDRGGWCWFIGVPEGFNHFKDLADYAKSGVDSDWGYYSWKSSEILDPKEIESAKRDLDPKTFRQEYEASFEGAAGRVYYPYKSGIHEDSTIKLNKHLPIILCTDFNVDPCVWEFLQFDGVRILVFDELALKNTNTVEMSKRAMSLYGNHDRGIVVYGDSAGGSRSTAGKSDYALMSEVGLTNQRIKKANPFVKDRVNAVNAMLMTTNETVRLYHSSRCVNLKKDFEEVQWAENNREIDKRSFDRTHATDALGYFIYSEFPLKSFKKNKRLKFYK